MSKTLRLAALVAGAVMVLGACTPAATTTPTAEPTITPTAEPSEGGTGPMTLEGHITLWHSYGSSGGGAESAEVQALNQILAGLATTYPDLEIEAINVPFSDIFNNFRNESATGGGPDMFIAPNDSLGDDARGGYLADLTGLIDEVIAETSDVAVGGSKVDGVLYMVPESLKAVAMYYDSANVPTPPTTTDELLAFVEGGGKAGVLTQGYFGWGWYSAFGGKIFNDDNSCAADDNSGVADAMAYVGALNDAGAVVDSDYAKINDPFIAGDLDVIFNGNWALGDYRAARAGLAVGPFVSGPGGPGRTMTGVDGWYINAAASADQQALAIAVAKLLVSAESQQIMVDVAGHVPANKNVTASDPLVASFTTAIYAGDPRPQSAAFGQYWGPFGAAWDAVVPNDDTAEGADATTAVAEACTTMEAAIATQ